MHIALIITLAIIGHIIMWSITGLIIYIKLIDDEIFATCFGFFWPVALPAVLVYKFLECTRDYLDYRKKR